MSTAAIAQNTASDPNGNTSKKVKLNDGRYSAATMSAVTRIVTHNGTHHADEALAVHLLRKLPQYASAELIRTRDKALIEQGTIVVDVGAEYDDARRRYDHHQRGFEETFDSAHKTKLSSAGLVWKCVSSARDSMEGVRELCSHRCDCLPIPTLSTDTTARISWQHTSLCP